MQSRSLIIPSGQTSKEHFTPFIEKTLRRKLETSTAEDTENTNAVAILGFTMATKNEATTKQITIFPRLVGINGIIFTLNYKASRGNWNEQRTVLRLCQTYTMIRNLQGRSRISLLGSVCFLSRLIVCFVFAILTNRVENFHSPLDFAATARIVAFPLGPTIGTDSFACPD